jgi:hypothetical protein
MRFGTLSGLLAGTFFFVTVTFVESEPSAHAAGSAVVAEPLTTASLAPTSTIDETQSGSNPLAALPAESDAAKEPLENPSVVDGTGPVDDMKDDKAPTQLERARAALAQSNAPALSNSEVCTRLVDVARANALPVGFFTNLIWRESKFDHEAISRAGAMGIAQFMPDVADKLGLNAFDPRDALPASGRLLSTLRARFNNLGLVAAAYNAGPKRVVDWLQQRAKLPKETRDYVSIITGRPIEQWLGKLKTVVFNIPRQVPCHQSMEFAEAEQAERAVQQARLAEEQKELERQKQLEKQRQAEKQKQLEKERMAAKAQSAQRKKGRHGIATANRAKATTGRARSQQARA